MNGVFEDRSQTSGHGKKQAGVLAEYERLQQLNRIIGNSAALQKTNERNLDNGETVHPGGKEGIAVRPSVIQGFGIPKWLKKAAKSSVWASITGLGYCLVGLISNPVSGLAIGTAGVCIVINILSVISNIFGALGKLDTSEQGADGTKEDEGFGEAIGRLGAWGSGMAASIDITYLARAATGIADEMLGVVTETIGALKAVVSLFRKDFKESEKAVKYLKYSLDLLAGIIGIVAFSVGVVNANASAWIFVGEVVVRALRFVVSLIKTIIDSCEQRGKKAKKDGPEVNDVQHESGADDFTAVDIVEPETDFTTVPIEPIPADDSTDVVPEGSV